MNFHIFRQFLDLIAAPKSQKQDDIDTGELLDLLIQKDGELKSQLKIGRDRIFLSVKYRSSFLIGD